jgi:phosphoribosyl 1,2-cyclic phosphodiesterase
MSYRFTILGCGSSGGVPRSARLPPAELEL